MDSLPKEILVEKENIEKVLGDLAKVMPLSVKSVIELSAIAVFLHNFYNGIENILKQSLKLKKVEIPRSESWHKDLLKFSAARGIISENLSDELYEYLTFRHFFVHGYSFNLKEKDLVVLAVNISLVWERFLSDIVSFIKGVSKKAQGILEYTLLLAAVIAVIVTVLFGTGGTSTGIKGKIKAAYDKTGIALENTVTNVDSTIFGVGVVATTTAAATN